MNQTQGAAPSKLSLRQRQVLELIRQGKSNNEIAFELGIGLGAVKQHVVALFRKLKVTSRTRALTRSTGENALAGHLPSCSSNDLVLERRPCVVFSPALDHDDPRLQRILKNILTMIAQETGDVVISWRGPGCDLILGVDHVSEADCLRALQGAWKRAQALARAFKEPSPPAWPWPACSARAAGPGRPWPAAPSPWPAGTQQMHKLGTCTWMLHYLTCFGCAVHHWTLNPQPSCNLIDA